ncbi:MAG TPA: acyl carrier protein [Candidatus Binatia bacterium]|nr:acyl carrier protein [Candidatus Binatia bacterium]
MYESIEQHVRAVVAERLGVAPEELTAEVSLVDDLAADSLDILELALGVEEALGIVVPDAALGGLRTYGDLLAIATTLVGRRERVAQEDRPPHVVARVWSPRGSGSRFERDVWLTPYGAETVAEDALGAGPGAHLELIVPAGASDADLARVRGRFTRLPPRGVEVSVRREQQAVPHPTAA